MTITSTAPRDWDSLISRAGGSVFHSTSWARFAQASYANLTPEFLIGDADGASPTYALVFHQRSRRRVLRGLTGHTWLDAYPIAPAYDPAAVATALTLIADHARARGDVEVDLGSFGGGDIRDVLTPLAFTLAQRLEFQLDLTRPEQELWDAMATSRRQKIKKGQKHNVVVEEMTPDKGLPVLRALQDQSAIRIASRGGQMSAYTGPSETDPARTLIDCGVARLWGARVGEVWVSAALLTCFNAQVYYMLSGHSARGLEVQSSSILLWDAIRSYRANGATRFNLGGCSLDAVDERSAEHGVYMYKKGFGGAILECANGHKTLRPTARRIRVALNRLMRRGTAE